MAARNLAARGPASLAPGLAVAIGVLVIGKPKQFDPDGSTGPALVSVEQWKTWELRKL